MSGLKNTPFQSVIDALLDNTKVINPVFLYRLSNLDGNERRLLEQNWEKIAIDRRRSLMADLERFSDADPLLDFVETCYVSIKDKDPEVRLLSIQTMWQEQSRSHAKLLMEIVKKDEDIDVRAAAVGSLGCYVYYGELEEIPEELYRQIEGVLLNLLKSDEHPLIQRKAIESMGYSGHPEIARWIYHALESDDDDWITSALISIGRSANPKWGETVIKFLDHPAPVIREEAAKAAGELELKESVQIMIEMLYDEDEDVQYAAIWALSEIGGKGVQEALEDALEIAESDELVGYIEEAIDNLTFYEGLEDFHLFNFNDEDLFNQNHKFGDGDG